VTTSGVCEPWTDLASVRGLPGFPDSTQVPDATVELAIGWATDVLFDLSGKQWPGECEDTVRPLGDHRCRSVSNWRREAVLRGGGWFGRGCMGIPEVDLGVYPLVSIQEVLLDGVDLDPTSYRIDNRRLLTRVDGQGWPCWQDVTKASDQPGTWEVSFTYGEVPPAGGVGSATIFARELALAFANNNSCRLPSRTQTVARQGVTIVAYPQSILDGGRTGLPEVDLWLASVNPKKIRQQATIMSPDYPPGVRRTS
jgi:hypothetical protein